MKHIRFLGHLVAFALFGCSKEETVSFSQFQEIASPVADDCSSIWMTDALRGSVVGGTPWKNGFILSTSDGGQTWQLDTFLNRKMECVMFDHSGQGYVCGQDFALYRPPNSQHWLDFRTNYLWNKACHFPDDRHGATVSGEGYRFGQIVAFGPDAFWRPDTLHELPNAITDIWFSDSITAHAVGMGWVTRSTDAGRSWQRHGVTGDFFCCVQFPTPTVGYVCGSSGRILKTTDGGQSWQEIRKGGSVGKRNQPFRALWFVNAETGYLVGDDGLFWYTDNGGADWAQVSEAPENVDFTDVFVLEGRGWAVAKNGRVFYFER